MENISKNKLLKKPLKPPVMKIRYQILGSWYRVQIVFICRWYEYLLRKSMGISELIKNTRFQ